MRLRRLVGGVAVGVLAAAVVVALGLLADAVGAARDGGPAAPVPAVGVDGTVTAGGGETVWDVARRVAPSGSGPEITAVAERIVTGNSLTSVQLAPGQVLRIPVG